jgi:hypothetical protein
VHGAGAGNRSGVRAPSCHRHHVEMRRRRHQRGCVYDVLTCAAPRRGQK